jgi:hypothetical protein
MLSPLTPPHNKSIALRSTPATSHTAHAPVPCPHANQRSGRLTGAFMREVIKAHPPEIIPDEIINLLEGLEKSPFVFDILEVEGQRRCIEACFNVLKDISEMGGSLQNASSTVIYFPENTDDPNKLTTFLQNNNLLDSLSNLGKSVQANVTALRESLSNEEVEQINLSELEQLIQSPYKGIKGSAEERMNHLVDFVMGRETLESSFESDKKGNGMESKICNWLKQWLNRFGV